MIKIEASLNKDYNFVLDVTGSNTNVETLDELDFIFKALMCNYKRRGSFVTSNQFRIEIKDESGDEKDIDNTPIKVNQ